MNREIGSEFPLDLTKIGTIMKVAPEYVLSGRTAIDIIIQDIRKYRPICSVYMPAYSCESMIDPFVRNHIEVQLYDMSFNQKLLYHIDFSFRPDILYVNNYFGYENTLDISIIQKFREQGAIIIYDQTHSLFMQNDPILELADYSFSSIRKWLGVVAGAIVRKNKCSMKYALQSYPHLDCKTRAMQEKAAYLEGNTSIDKAHFLHLFEEFGHHLAHDYQDYQMDDISYTIWTTTDYQQLRFQRYCNAKYLHRYAQLQYLGQMTNSCCPLFVPILLNNRVQRDQLRQQLINNHIYCPIHWAKNHLVTPTMQVNQLFDTELSLICDQRYGEEDMQRIIACLNQYL